MSSARRRGEAESASVPGMPVATVSRGQAAATLLSSLLFVLAFPQYGGAWHLDVLAWFALVPFLVAAAGRGGWSGILLGAALGCAIEAGGFIWIYHAARVFTEMPRVLAVVAFLFWLTYSMLPWILLGGVLGRCRGATSILWVVPFWVGVEHYFPRLWTWHFGVALAPRETLLQCADLFGASGLTALMLLTNVVLFLVWRARHRRLPLPWKSVATWIVALVFANVYGSIRLQQVQRFEQSREPIRVLLLQGALGFGERLAAGLETYRRLTQKTLTDLSDGEVDLVVWPEGAISQARRVGQGIRDDAVFNLTAGADPWLGFRSFGVERPDVGVPLFAGGTGFVAGRKLPLSNVAVYLVPGRTPEFYEKIVRVPFGEVIPFATLLPESVLERFDIPVGTIAAGEKNSRLKLGDSQFRSLICYEAILPEFVRQNSRGVDFMVNITEDIWYGLTAHIPQHAAVLQLRVVENRTPLVRCTNVGPSGVVHASGRFDQGENILSREVVVKEVRPGRMPTLYGAGGHWFAPALLCLSVLRGGLRTVRRRPARTEKTVAR